MLVLPLALLEVAAVLSTSANGLVTLALPWLVLERTGSPVAAGLIAAASTLPLLAGALFAGTVVDLFGPRRTAVCSDLLSASSVAAIPLVERAFGFSLGALAVLALIGAVFDLAGITARKAILPVAAARARWRLERANGVHESAKGLALLAGPALGGVLIGFGGAVAALWAAAAASALATLFTLLVRLPWTPGEQAVSARIVWRGAAEGLSLVWHDRLLRPMALIGGTLFMVYLPIAGVVLPTYFHEQGAPERFGLLNVAMTLGGVAGSLAYAFWGHRPPKRAMFVAATICASVGLLAMSWLPPYPVLLLFAALVGLSYGPISPLTNLATQLRSTERTRGRVMGIMTSSGYVAGPIGYLAGGPLVEHLGTRTAFMLLAAALCVLVAWVALLPALRQFDALPEPTT